MTDFRCKIERYNKPDVYCSTVTCNVDSDKSAKALVSDLMQQLIERKYIVIVNSFGVTMAITKNDVSSIEVWDNDQKSASVQAG